MNEIAQAASILRRGGLVAFPTETVYGLGADATSRAAVLRIFAAKGRPATNPIIVHVADASAARRYAGVWPDEAEKLARRFWPGPLTLVLPKDASIVAEATAGLDTVGLRCPDHPLALELLREFDGPVAAPSANRSTRVSPTTAQHVRDELGDAVDMVLDGGPCRVGIESTVLDLASGEARILRPGNVSAEQIEAEIGAVRMASVVVDGAEAAMSPGQQAVHYAPKARAYRFERGRADVVRQWRQSHATEQAAGLFLEGSDKKVGGELHMKVVQMPDEPAEYARRLYATFRELDDAGTEVIWVEMPPDEPRWAAVRDRLTRATAAA